MRLFLCFISLISLFIALYSQEVIIVSQFMVFDGNRSDVRYLTAISTQYVNKFWRNGIFASIKEIFALIEFLKRDRMSFD